MSDFPTTPSKSSLPSAKGYICPGSRIGSRHHGVPYASPASTITETSSQPMTPLDCVALGSRTGQAGQLNVQLPSIGEVVSIDFGSPLQTRKLLYRPSLSEINAASIHLPSPARLRNGRLETIHTDAQSNASPQTQPPSDPFVRGSFSLQEDPFDVRRASTPTRQTRSADVTPVKQRQHSTMSAHTTPSSTASKRTSIKMGDLVVGAALGKNDGARYYSPRVDRMAEKPSADNAQGLYLPNACVFVANLPKACEDEQLKATVDQVFNEFGTCYTKVHRGNENMPFAHVQYETNAIATKAIIAGKGRDIEGRPCRTELSNAKVSLYVSSISGSRIDRDEVMGILRHYGEIAEAWSPTLTEYTFNKLPLGGMFFRFAYFLDCVDALQSLRSHPKYRFESRVEPQAQQGQRLTHRRAQPSQASSVPRRQVAVEQRMPAKVIMVHNLPSETTYRTLATIFDSYGTISACNVMVQLPARFATAIVEYTAASSAVAAVENQDGKPHTATGDHKLRVTFYSGGLLSQQLSGRPFAKHGHHTWVTQDLNRGQAAHSIHPYSPSMTPHSASMSYYTLSAPSTPASPSGMVPSSYAAQFAQQFYNMCGHGSPSVFGVPQGYQLPEGR